MSPLKPLVRVAITENGRTSTGYARDEGATFWCRFDDGRAYSVARECVTVAHDVTPCDVPETPYGGGKESR